jgi:hypothetical protein
MPPQIPFDYGLSVQATPCHWTLKYFFAYENRRNVYPGVADVPCPPLTAPHRYGQSHSDLHQGPVTMSFRLTKGHLPSSYPLHKCQLYCHLHQLIIMIHGHHLQTINMTAWPPTSRGLVCIGDILLFFISSNKCIAGNGSFSGSISNLPPWGLSNLSVVGKFSQILCQFYDISDIYR